MEPFCVLDRLSSGHIKFHFAFFSGKIFSTLFDLEREGESDTGNFSLLFFLLWRRKDHRVENRGQNI